MERRHLTFIAVALAIIVAGQALQAWLFPPPVKPPAPESREVVEPESPAPAPEGGSTEVADAATEPKPEDPAGADAARERRTLGSLDAADPARMLVTLTSRGAAVERIELADPRFHDQDDRSGYVGHLAPVAGAAGCRLGVVGDGTPAARAGLRAGDELVRVDGLATPDPRTLRDLLAATRPGQRLSVEFVRDGGTMSCELETARRPLEVVRPEHRAEPVADPDGDTHDPLSFLLSLERRDGRTRREGAADLPGHELADVDWTTAPTADGSGVRFTRSLPGGLTIAKEYRIAAPPDAAQETGYRLGLTVEVRSPERETVIVYALDGPTGLPTEGWWYAQRVGPEMFGGLAVRDVVMRFTGEKSALVSGLKIADGSLEHPSSAILEGKPLAFATRATVAAFQ